MGKILSKVRVKAGEVEQGHAKTKHAFEENPVLRTLNKETKLDGW